MALPPMTSAARRRTLHSSGVLSRPSSAAMLPGLSRRRATLDGLLHSAGYSALAPPPLAAASTALRVAHHNVFEDGASLHPPLPTDCSFKKRPYRSDRVTRD